MIIMPGGQACRRIYRKMHFGRRDDVFDPQWCLVQNTDEHELAGLFGGEMDRHGLAGPASQMPCRLAVANLIGCRCMSDDEIAVDRVGPRRQWPQDGSGLGGVSGIEHNGHG